MPTVEIRANTTAINAQLDGMLADIEAAALPAAQAGAEVLRAQVVSNVDALTHVKTGKLRNAIYAVLRDREVRPGFAKFRVSWDRRKAPHGHLVEFGHIQRFKQYLGKDGAWHTRIRPEALGMRVVRTDAGKLIMVRDPSLTKQRKPRSRAPLAQKMAYYDPLPTPRQVPARPFLRNATVAMPRALEVAEDEFFRRLSK